MKAKITDAVYMKKQIEKILNDAEGTGKVIFRSWRDKAKIELLLLELINDCL